MSARALAKGIVKTVRDALGDTAGTYVGSRKGLRPPAVFGEVYVGVGEISSTRGPTQSGDVDDRVYTAQVCVTARYGYAPEDRTDDEMDRELTDDEWESFADIRERRPQLRDIADRIGGLLIESYAVVNNANSFITGAGSTTNGFVEPAHFMATGKTEEKLPSWAYVADKDQQAEVSGTLFACTVTVSGFRRIRVRGTF